MNGNPVKGNKNSRLCLAPSECVATALLGVTPICIPTATHRIAAFEPLHNAVTMRTHPTVMSLPCLSLASSKGDTVKLALKVAGLSQQSLSPAQQLPELMSKAAWIASDRQDACGRWRPVRPASSSRLAASCWPHLADSQLAPDGKQRPPGSGWRTDSGGLSGWPDDGWPGYLFG